MNNNNYSKSNRKKGFTLLELIVVMAVSVMIIGVIYTFYIVNQKSLSRAEINSTLQGEAATIQKEVDVIGAQGKSITSMVDATTNSTVTPGSITYASVDTAVENGSIKGYSVKSITTQIYSGESASTVTPYLSGYYTLYLDDIPGKTEKKLYLKNDLNTGHGKLLSSNAVSMSITPLNYQSVANKATATFDKTTGLQITIILHIKKGFSDITYPVTTVVNFRNSDL